jgi:hypothetical protein
MLGMDEIERLISEIVADPEVRAKMLKIQPIDEPIIPLDIYLGLWYTVGERNTRMIIETTVTPTPEAGATLYRVWNGELETATFVKEQILEGASRPTWTVQKDDPSKSWYESRGVVSPNYYHLTEKKAWEDYVEDLKLSAPQLEKAVTTAQVQHAQCLALLIEAEAKVEELS